MSDEGRDSYGAKIGANDHLIVSLGLAALIVVAFWGIELRLLLLTVVIVVIACLAFMPAFWERIDRKKDG